MSRVQERDSAQTETDAIAQSQANKTPSAVELAEALMQTVHAFKRRGNLCIAQQEMSHELSVPRIRLLAAVADARLIDAPVRMGDLSVALGVTARTVTASVDALEKEGLIARHPDPKDRRAIRIELTPAGQAHIEHINALQEQISEAFLAPLSAEQRCQLFDILSCLTKAHNTAAD